jgi:hypothetical protein
MMRQRITLPVPGGRPAHQPALGLSLPVHGAGPLRLTHYGGRPYHLPAPDRIICGMALPVAPT